MRINLRKVVNEEKQKRQEEFLQILGDWSESSTQNSLQYIVNAPPSPSPSSSNEVTAGLPQKTPSYLKD